MTRFLLLLLPLLAVFGCQRSTSETGEVEVAARYHLHPEVAGQGTAVDVDLVADRSAFIFGETGLELGEGITIESVTVHDGYRATATVQVDPDASLGARDARISIADNDILLEDGFSVIAESFRIDPDNGKMGETFDVAMVGTATAWEAGYTWTSFGDGVDVLDFRVLSDTLATATLSIRPDARPGPRDVTMEDGPDVVTLYDGFIVDRAVITAFWDPPQAYQGDTVEFTITGLDTAFDAGTGLEFWDDGGRNADITVTQLTVLDAQNMYGRIRLSNAARLGGRDVLISAGDESVRIPDAFEVLDAPPDLSNVAVGLGFDVFREIDNSTGDLYEVVQAFAYFVIPLDPPCGPVPPMGSGPMPYDANGVFPVPPEPEPVDCPDPETVSAGDYVWFESDANVVTLHKDYYAPTNMIIYRGQDLTLADYQFGQLYDLHTQGDPDGIPEVIVPEVQPTVPADWTLTSPELWGDFTQPRTEPFTYTWTPAQTYPEAFFITQISGTLVATGDGGFAGCIPWDDGVHTYTSGELLALNAGPVSYAALSYIEGPEFGLPFSTIQSNQSNSVLQLTAAMVLE